MEVYARVGLSLENPKGNCEQSIKTLLVWIQLNAAEVCDISVEHMHKIFLSVVMYSQFAH